MTDFKERKALLSKLVAHLEAVVPYADAVYIQNTTRALTCDKTGTEPHTAATAGVKIRAFDGLQYHELCIQGWQPQLLQAEVQALITRLKTRPVGVKTVTIKADRDIIDKDFAVTLMNDPRTVSVAEKAAMINTYYEKAMKHSADIVNCRVSYREEEEERIFVNRYKKLASTWVGCSITLMPFVQTADGQTRFDYYTNFSHNYDVTRIPDERLQSLLKRAVKLKGAARIPAGKYTAILSPNVSGLLAHESFGHGMESDMLLRGRAKAEEYLGKRIAPAKVNICDDPSIEDTHGHLFFDDEGVMPSRAFMVKSGVVTAPITESYSASRKGFSRTANGRTESFDHKIYARMTNTFFLQGKDDPAAMLKSVKNGIYLHYGTSGMEDPKGWGVQIAGIVAERIKNGKLTGELFYEVSISGYLPTILGNIQMVGKDFMIKEDAGFCGKGHKEYVRVSSGGPHILIKELDLS